MIIEIKQIIINEGIMDSFKSLGKLLPKKKEFKITSTPADTRKLQAIEKAKRQIKLEIAAIDMQKKVMDRVQLSPEDLKHLNKPSRLLNQPHQPHSFKSSQIKPQDKNNPYRHYLDKVYA